MPKVRIKVLIKNKIIDIEKEYNAIYNDGKIVYKEDKNIKMQYDMNNNILERQTNEMNIKYAFNLNKETHGQIYIKELQKYLDITIKTNTLKNTEKLIEIEYKIEGEDHIFKLEVL